MAEAHFDQDVWIATEPDAVFEEVVDVHRMIGLQPLLETVRDLPPASDGAARYEAIECLRLLGVFRLRNPVTVEVRPRADRRAVDFVAESGRGGVVLRNRIEMAPEGAGTRVVERVRVTMPAIFRPYVLYEARRAHRRLLASLKERLEAAARA